MCAPDSLAHGVRAEPVEDADGLGGRKREVEARDATFGRHVARRQRRAVPRRQTGEDGVQILRHHLPREAEVSARRPDPYTRCLAGARVVLLSGGGHSVEVIARRACSHLGDAQHGVFDSTGRRTLTAMAPRCAVCIDTASTWKGCVHCRCRATAGHSVSTASGRGVSHDQPGRSRTAKPRQPTCGPPVLDGPGSYRRDNSSRSAACG